MPKKSGLEVMMEYIQKYLDGKMSRDDFDMDFDRHLDAEYPKMKRKYPDLADCFYYYIVEEGVNQIGELDSDTSHKKVMRKQLKEFKSVFEDGIL